MRMALISLVLLFAVSAGAAGRGHVAVFYLLPYETDDDELVEVIADFSYYMPAIESWLDERGITHTFHNSLPFEIELSPDKRLVFGEELRKFDLGFVLIRPDGTFEVLEGVHTGADFSYLAAGFFGLERGEQ